MREGVIRDLFKGQSRNKKTPYVGRELVRDTNSRKGERTEVTYVEDLTLFVRVLVARDDVRRAGGCADGR